MKKSIHVLIIAIFVIGFIVRLYRFDNPIADWHSWRQADTSSVSRIFEEKGFDILHPRYLDISNIQTGVNNPEGFRFVEFPLYNIFQALTHKFVGIFSLEEWGRLITILSSLLTGLFLFLLAKKYFNETAAIFSLLFYIFVPFSIYYGRTILPDTSMIMASFGGIYFLDRYLREKSTKKYLFLGFSTLFTMSSLLLKPYAIIFALPQVFLVFEKYKYNVFLKKELWLHLFFSVVPLVFWRLWILNFPEGVPASSWLLNGNRIRFRPSFFRWIIYERLTKLILGYTGILIVLSGLLSFKQTKNYLFALSFLVSSALYVIVFATGNVQHDYYQILIIPSVALFAGLGMNFLFSKGRIFGTFGIFLLALGFILSWNQVKDYFNINNEALVIAGKRADEILPKNAKVIAPYDGDTTLLYYINRKGWPAFQAGIDELKTLGATHMVLVKPSQNDINGFGKKYKIKDQSSDYLILEL